MLLAILIALLIAAYAPPAYAYTPSKSATAYSRRWMLSTPAILAGDLLFAPIGPAHAGELCLDEPPSSKMAAASVGCSGGGSDSAFAAALKAANASVSAPAAAPSPPRTVPVLGASDLQRAMTEGARIKSADPRAHG